MWLRGLAAIGFILTLTVTEARAQDSGIPDTLRQACALFRMPESDSLALPIAIFTDDSLIVVSVTFCHHSSQTVVSSVSVGNLIPESAPRPFLSNHSEDRSFTVTWVGLEHPLTAPSSGIFAIVYLKFEPNIPCPHDLFVDTCFIPPASGTQFTPKRGLSYNPEYPSACEIRCPAVENAPFEETIEAHGIQVTIHPNPFNSGTMFELDMPASEHLTITIYDVLGRHVRTIVDNLVTCGPHQFAWGGTHESGKSSASGVYFAEITTPSLQMTRKLVLLR